jgi:hypothetical protein
MPDEKAHNLTAYDADTGKQVFYWPNVLTRHLVKNDIIPHDGKQWRVIGVRGDSTADEWHVEVRLVTQPEG